MPEKPKDKGESLDTGEPVTEIVETVSETLPARIDGAEVQTSDDEPVVGVVSAVSESATTFVPTNTVFAIVT